MRTYKLKHDRDFGKDLPKTYEASRDIDAGDVIELENGMWHGVIEARKTPQGMLLVLAESGQSAVQAELLLKQQLSE
jgi:uncharacterized protein YijF (DUF1287 family)